MIYIKKLILVYRQIREKNTYIIDTGEVNVSTKRNIGIQISDSEYLVFIDSDDFIFKKNLSKYFIDYHLVPMVSAIWSMPPYEAKKMPLKFFIKFFQNHGLFKLKKFCFS